MGGVTTAIAGAATGAAGAFFMDLGLSYGQPYLPEMLTAPGWGRVFTRYAGAFLIGWGASFFVSRQTANAVTAGALTVVTYDLVKQLANQYMLPPAHQLGGEDGSYPFTGYNPYLTGMGRGGSTGYSGEQAGMAGYIGRRGMAGYLKGPGTVRSTQFRRAPTVSAFVEPEAGGTSSMGADLEV